MIEIGDKNLNFLDVTIINNNNFLEFDVYKKPTFSGRVLSFLSKPSFSKKRCDYEYGKQNLFVVTSEIP